ncbi:hypothetical protein HHI36_008954 [Cryptolaemus montrouzieri]|uniref:Cystinosin n=1 Tax=Cryptolaemus montrouzieri TaxID=559131 RepID=A0ABD2MUB8_9CUCU
MRFRVFESLLLLWITCISNSLCDVKISTHDVKLTVGETKAINLEISLDDVYIRVTIDKVPLLDILSVIIGWLYFAAWTISFYPQIYINYKTKSVVGLNFDSLAFNLIGFTLYTIFNIGLYFINSVKEEYFDRYPRGLNPVHLNDVFFSVHAVLATRIIIIQCCIYKRDKQKVSITARLIIAVFAIFILGNAILTFTKVIQFLDVLNNFSYVKLTTTIIQYVPQAYMNYKKKSTVGWSIGTVLLDFAGGILSMLQMILKAYNYDDWVSIFGDPTKFGVGFFSVLFDVLFIVQHYVLYGDTNYEVNQ